MADFSLLTWAVGVGALVVGILAGHFGWGRRWLAASSKAGSNRYARLHPDYLTGLDYLVTEQPDRALDMFLKLMDANADTLETHFALGALYRRRGEVERAIRIHQSLLAREALAPEHREQALLALAHDHLRAGLLDRAEELFKKVSEVPRLRAGALDSLRTVYERQHEWQQALDVSRQLARIDSGPPPRVAAHYSCELAALALDHADLEAAKRHVRAARGEVSFLPRAALLRARIAEREGATELAIGLMRAALREAPVLLHDELPHLLRLVGAAARDSMLIELVQAAEVRGPDERKRLVFAAASAGLAEAAPLRVPVERVFSDLALADLERSRGGRPGSSAPIDVLEFAAQIGALLARAEKYRCSECGFAARSFYWHCPACHAWDSFEAYTIVKLG